MNETSLQRKTLLLLLALVTIAFIWILLPFYGAIFWAVALGILFAPLQRKMLLKLKGASGNNLKDVDLEIPSGLFTAVTGVSGSGKSTLINDTLYALAAKRSAFAWLRKSARA